MRKKALVAAAMTALVCSVAGCGAETNRRTVPDTAVRDLTLREEIEVERAEERLVKECMEKKGFPYWELPVPGADERRTGRYVTDDVEWARKYGYGRVFEERGEKIRRTHPISAYQNRLGPKQRAAFTEALDGDYHDRMSVELPGGAGSARGLCQRGPFEALRRLRDLVRHPQDRLPRDITAVPLGPDNPSARLAFTYFSQLAGAGDLHQWTHADAVVEPSVELLRAVLATQHGNSTVAKGPLEATLSLRITQYIRAHLADPDLSAARIASAHAISVRHLYAVLSLSGISLGDWIRTRRLAECRRELAGPNGRLRTIAATGRRWGFVNATHFSKVFKQTYGISPRDWRGQNHPRSSA